MLKIAAIGDRESVLGFSAIGMEVFSPPKNECAPFLKSFSFEDYAIIYITEEYAEYCKDIIEKFENRMSPALILIPGVKNNTGEGIKKLNRTVEKAVGSQLPE